MRCKKCGTELPNNAQFCGRCGAAVERGNGEVPKKKKRWIWIAVVAGISLGIAAVAIGIEIALVLGRSNDKASEQPAASVQESTIAEEEAEKETLDGAETPTSSKDAAEDNQMNRTSEQTAQQSFAGEWIIDVEKTNSLNDASLQDAYGTGIQYGYHLTLGEDGSFSWGIGLGNGGEGTWRAEGETIYADETEYESGTQETIELKILSENEQTWLVQDHYGYTLYWVKEKTEAEKNAIYQTAADAYQRFLSSGEYRTVIDSEDKWLDSAIQECAGVQWGDSADGYAILDIDGDSTPELLIRSNCGVEDDWYYAAVFSFDADSQSVRLLAELHPYGEITHSDYSSSIQYYDQFSFTSGKTNFCTVQDGELLRMYAVIFAADYYRGNNEYGRWQYEDSHGTTELSREDYDQYFQDAEAVEFQFIDPNGMSSDDNQTEVNAETKNTETDESQASSALDLTAYYWYQNIQCAMIFTFQQDGTYTAWYTEPIICPSEENVPAENALMEDENDSGIYSFDGKTLTLTRNDGYTISMDLYNAKTDAPVSDAAAQCIQDYDGSLYFYETDWVMDPDALSDNAFYLIRLGAR